jgi:hypothetical protein
MLHGGSFRPTLFQNTDRQLQTLKKMVPILRNLYKSGALTTSPDSSMVGGHVNGAGFMRFRNNATHHKGKQSLTPHHRCGGRRKQPTVKPDHHVLRSQSPTDRTCSSTHRRERL